MSILPWRLTSVVGERVDLRRIGDVHQRDLGVVALLAHLVAAALGDRRVVIGDDHLGARLGERLDDGEPDGAPAAGDERRAAGEPEHLEIHLRSSCLDPASLPPQAARARPVLVEAMDVLGSGVSPMGSPGFTATSPGARTVISPMPSTWT